MQNLEDYTPEMLVFYQNLPAPVQNAVRHADADKIDKLGSKRGAASRMWSWRIWTAWLYLLKIWPSCTTADAERRAEHAFG